MDHDTLTNAVDALKDILFEAQLFEQHFGLLLDFLDTVLEQRSINSADAKHGPGLEALDFRVICCLKRFMTFHAVHCRTRMVSASPETADIEEKLQRYDDVAVRYPVESRRKLYACAKECRSILNADDLSLKLNKMIFETMMFCEEYEQYFPGFNCASPAYLCRTRMQQIRYTYEYTTRLKYNMYELYKLRNMLDSKLAKDVADYAENFDRIHQYIDPRKMENRAKLYSRVCDGILLKFTFLPRFDPTRFEVTTKLYESKVCFRGQLLVNSKMHEREEFFLNLISLKDLDELDAASRADFIYLLEVLSQSEKKNSGLLSLLGMVYTDSCIYFVFENFECSLYTAIREKRSREMKDILNIYQTLVKGLRYLHCNHVLHGGIDPKNIFLEQKSMDTLALDVKLGFVNILDTFKIKRDGLENVSSEEILNKAWGEFVYQAPELFMSKFENELNKQSLSNGGPPTAPALCKDYGYNASCDVYSLSICIYQSMAPVFAADWNDMDSRKEAIDRFSFPFKHAMGIMHIDTERKHKVKYKKLAAPQRKMFDRELTLAFVSLVCTLHPEIPFSFDDSIKDGNKCLTQILEAVKSSWETQDFHRPGIDQLYMALDNISKRYSDSVLDYDGFKLVVAKEKGFKLTPDGLDFKELYAILYDYFKYNDYSKLPEVKQMAMKLGAGLSLEDFDREFKAVYGVGLKLDELRYKYQLNGFREYQSSLGGSTMLKVGNLNNIATLRQMYMSTRPVSRKRTDGVKGSMLEMPTKSASMEINSTRVSPTYSKADELTRSDNLAALKVSRTPVYTSSERSLPPLPDEDIPPPPPPKVRSDSKHGSMNSFQSVRNRGVTLSSFHMPPGSTESGKNDSDGFDLKRLRKQGSLTSFRDFTEADLESII